MAKCLLCDVCPFDSNQAGGSGYSLPIASCSQLGGVMIGGGLSITAEGILNCTLSGGESYTLPIAGVSTLGGVMIGNGLSIAYDGTLNVTASLGLSAYATKSDVANSLSAALGGLSSYILPIASPAQIGGIKVGSGLSMAGDTLNATLSSEDVISEAVQLFVEALQAAGS